MRKLVFVFMLCLSFSLFACGGNGSASKGGKGTKDNPYTLEDTITVTSTSYETDMNTFPLKKIVLGTNTFELSNFRIEEVEISNNFNGETGVIKLLVFDKKCTETSFDDGIDWLNNGDIRVDNFFDENMQVLEYTNFTEDYTGLEEHKRVFFEGTTYTEAYALTSLDDGIDTNSVGYHLLRMCYNDKELEEQYIYIKLD